MSSQTGSVGINTANPDPSALLDLTSNSKGLLLPRLTSTAISNLSLSAAEGLDVYDITNKQFLDWDGSKWQILGNSTGKTSVSLVSWEVSGYLNYGASPVSASTTNPAVITSATLARGTGVAANSSGAIATWGGTNWVGADLATATSSNSFALVTLNLVPGENISLSKISGNNLRRTSTGPSTSQYQFSVDGGTNYTSIGSAINLASTDANGNNIAAIDLSIYPSLQNVNTSTTPRIIFRIVSYGASSTTGNWYINNISTADLEFTGSIN